MTPHARRFQFVEESYEGGTPAISCDGLVPGAALDLTHWQGNRTPPQLQGRHVHRDRLEFRWLAGGRRAMGGRRGGQQPL